MAKQPSGTGYQIWLESNCVRGGTDEPQAGNGPLELNLSSGDPRMVRL